MLDAERGSNRFIRYMLSLLDTGNHEATGNRWTESIFARLSIYIDITRNEIRHTDNEERHNKIKNRSICKLITFDVTIPHLMGTQFPIKKSEYRFFEKFHSVE